MSDINWKEVAQIVYRHARRAGRLPEDREKFEEWALKLEEVGKNYNTQDIEISRLRSIIERNKEKYLEVQEGAKKWRLRALEAEKKLRGSVNA